jgi:2-oxoglutarate/2-oxoacid ferredoxin oxidoreductase subunit beta
MRVLEEANREQKLLTGLLYINPNQHSLTRIYNLTDTPLNRLGEDKLRPSRESIERVNSMMF